jgi:hypothetical protein
VPLLFGFFMERTDGKNKTRFLMTYSADASATFIVGGASASLLRIARTDYSIGRFIDGKKLLAKPRPQ